MARASAGGFDSCRASWGRVSAEENPDNYLLYQVFGRTPLELPYLETQCNHDKQNEAQRHGEAPAAEAELSRGIAGRLVDIFNSRSSFVDHETGGWILSFPV